MLDLRHSNQRESTDRQIEILFEFPLVEHTVPCYNIRYEINKAGTDYE